MNKTFIVKGIGPGVHLSPALDMSVQEGDVLECEAELGARISWLKAKPPSKKKASKKKAE